MTVQETSNGEIQIAYETFGPSDGEPMLLVMGTGGQMLDWREDFCRQLGERGFRVTRFDNRDAGLSTHLTGAGTPSQFRMLFRPTAAAAYRLEDMADDALAVLDAQGWRSAHLVGRSLGGMIAQVVATRHPDRVRTLTSIASSPAPRIGRPGLGMLRKIVKVANPKRVKTREDFEQYVVDLQRLVGSPAYPADEQALREHARQCYDRGGLEVASVQRQTAAIVASGDRRAQLATLRVPTLVLQGDADPMFRPEAGRATAEAIPGARLVTYPGLGHDLPRALWPTIIGEIATLAEHAHAGEPAPER